MQTVRVNSETYRDLMVVKHEQELIKIATVNMSDVLDVVLWRYKQFVEGDMSAEEILNTKFIFTDTADKVATPILSGDDEDEEEEERPRPKKKKKSSSAAAKKRRRRVE